MRKPLIGTTVALLLFFGATTPLHAWNSFGHMAVARVAYLQLTASTRARVKALLKKNPYAKKIWPGMLPAGVSADDADMMTFMIAATWPDQIKSDGSYHSDGTDNGNTPPNDPSAGQNIGYRDHARHKYWHFVDTPFSQDGTTLPPLPSPNAQTQIAKFRATLASTSSSDALKSYNLTWLLHLVGDVHQPLHSATRVSASKPNGDNGGNDVKLSCSGCGSELHAFWDGRLGAGTSITRVITVATALPAANATAAAKTKETDWIDESFEAAKATVYKTPIGPGNGPFSLDATYKTAAKTLAQERVALAGARLANLLNGELK